jgi:hypothetical protein
MRGARESCAGENEAGIVEVECAVHPDMKMVIEVEK